MSQLFDALQPAQITRARKLPAMPGSKDEVELPDRRRSRRSSMDIPVYVYGYGPNQEPFHEEAHTLQVNANGALLLLSVPVRDGQELLLTNTFTQQEQDCRIVFLGTRHSRTIEAGIAFPETNPHFWQVHPAEDDDSAV
jgi:hypothetical protein